MDMFKVTTEIRAIILSSKEITAIIGNKVFPIIAPEGTNGDFIIYQRDGYKQNDTKFGVALQIPIVNICVISEDYDRSQDLASLIYDSLSRKFNNPNMVIKLEDSTEDYVDKKFIQVLQFSISSI